jgi:hypothetical protein
MIMDASCKQPVVAPKRMWSAPWTGSAAALAGSYELLAARVDDQRVVVVEGSSDAQVAVGRARATGAEAWRSTTAVAVVLPDTLAEPIHAVIRTAAEQAALVELDAATGAVVRTLPLAAELVPASASWYRAGRDIISVSQAAIVRIDTARGVAAWRTAPAGVVLVAPLGFAATATRAYVVCHAGLGADRRYGLCRFALADGRLEDHHDQDVAQLAVAGPGQVAVLDDRAVSVLADDGSTRWTQPLPDGFRGHRLVASERWVAVFALGPEDRSHAALGRRGPLLWAAYDAASGAPSWRVESSPAEALASSALALHGDWLVYGRPYHEEARPALRLRRLPDGDDHQLVDLDAAIHNPLLGAVSVESLRGEPVVAPPLVLVPRRASLELYQAR